MLDAVFVSRGLASIVIFCKNRDGTSLYLAELEEFINGYELWEVNEGNIKIPTEKQLPKTDQNSLFNQIKIDLLPFEYRSIFNDLLNTLNQTYILSKIYAPEYGPLLSDCNSVVHELWAMILYFQDKFTDKDLEDQLLKLYPKSSNDISHIIHQNQIIKNDKIQRVIRLHQLKDETVQLFAITQNFCRQGLSGTISIVESNYEVGEDSLLGIGAVFSGLISIYFKLRNSFSFAADVKKIAKAFQRFKSPELPHPSDLPTWARNLQDFDSISDAIAFCTITEPSPHLLYFSKRLGFRETKYSYMFRGRL